MITTSPALKHLNSVKLFSHQLCSDLIISLIISELFQIWRSNVIQSETK
jgi:hypothetical protein